MLRLSVTFFQERCRAFDLELKETFARGEHPV
jgi:hypothetical protein